MKKVRERQISYDVNYMQNQKIIQTIFFCETLIHGKQPGNGNWLLHAIFQNLSKVVQKYKIVSVDFWWFFKPCLMNIELAIKWEHKNRREKKGKDRKSNFLISPKENKIPLYVIWGFSDSSVGKESACNARDPGSIPGSGRSSGEGIGYLPQ